MRSILPMGLGLIYMLAGSWGAVWAETAEKEIPVRQETLGQWHYLHDLEVRPFNNAQGFPTAVTFGAEKKRAAVLLPGSYLVAEFRAGHFHDLHLPTDLMPSYIKEAAARLYNAVAF